MRPHFELHKFALKEVRKGKKRPTGRLEKKALKILFINHSTKYSFLDFQ